MTLLALLEALLAAFFGQAVAPVATKVIEDSVSGALKRPADTVTEGYVDPDVDAQVQAALDNPTGVATP